MNGDSSKSSFNVEGDPRDYLSGGRDTSYCCAPSPVVSVEKYKAVVQNRKKYVKTMPAQRQEVVFTPLSASD